MSKDPLPLLFQHTLESSLRLSVAERERREGGETHDGPAPSAAESKVRIKTKRTTIDSSSWKTGLFLFPSPGIAKKSNFHGKSWLKN
ncbi:unnamed protein product [Boreogadus saida]